MCKILTNAILSLDTAFLSNEASDPLEGFFFFDEKQMFPLWIALAASIFFVVHFRIHQSSMRTYYEC
ncbi:hypothetical protein BpHYR1_003801 [Brachionus plicatilis]|uniref:Uncharacterized protein n=1 Tax=Brachionus plicatilis TaxID=10195 RepID=A0A3M7RNV6_BRAPC|nr:hypothetical protein BpHYR1_003801 [Brachionus plicatilis]